MFVLCFMLHCIVSFIVLQPLDHLMGKEELVALLRLSSCCLVIVIALLLFSHVTVGWSAVCACGIS